MNPLRIRALARKEFYHLIRDYRSLYLAFAIPLMLIVLFGYALSLDVDNVDTVVVDYDRSDVSRDFIRKLAASPYFNVTLQASGTKEVSAYIDRDEAKVALIIPLISQKPSAPTGKPPCRLSSTAVIPTLPASFAVILRLLPSNIIRNCCLIS